MFYHLLQSKLIPKKASNNGNDEKRYCRIFGIDYKTLFNWKKDRPNFYKTVMLGLMVEKIIEKSEKNIEELKKLKKSFETKKEKL